MAITQRRYLDDVFPKIVARQDETYRPVRQLNEAVNRSYERVKTRVNTPRKKLVVSQKQENYNVAQRRQRQVTTRGYEHTKKEKQQHKREDIQRAKRHRVERNLSSNKPIVKYRPQAQLWDADKVDKAKNQKDFISNGVWTIGQNWGNLNPYSQQDIIQNAYDASSFGPRLIGNTLTTLVPFGQAPGRFITTLGAGYLGKKATDLGVRAFSDYDSWADLTNKKWGWSPIEADLTNIGMWLAGSGYNRIANAYVNPNSLLNQNIRMSLYNRKAPLGYDLADKNNYIPFVEGIANAAIGKQIPQKAQTSQIYDYLKWLNKQGFINESNIPKPISGQTAFDYVNSLPYNLKNQAAAMNNRTVAWDKYLGLNKLKDSDLFYNNNGVLAKTKYKQNSDGSFDVQLDPSLARDYIGTAMPNRKTGYPIRSDGRFVGHDNILGNHGGMNGQISPSLEYDKGILTANDVFDIMPMHKFSKWKHFEKIPKSIRNFEVSGIIPGAKPFKANFNFGNNKFEYPRGSVSIRRNALENYQRYIKDFNTYNWVNPAWLTKPRYFGRTF